MKALKHISFLALLAACSGVGNDQTELDSTLDIEAVETVDVGTIELPSDGTPALATVQWYDETISFYDHTLPEDASPVIMMERDIKDGGRELVTEMLEQTGMPFVTPAEIWMAATGRTDVPKALELQHLAGTAEGGRDSAYVKFTVKKELGYSLYHWNDMFFIPTNVPGIPGSKCWDKSREVGALVSTGQPASHACANIAPSTNYTAFTYAQMSNVNLSANCKGTGDITTADRDYVRVGLQNVTEGTPNKYVFAQTCYGTSSVWQCEGAAVLKSPNFRISEYPLGNKGRRLSIGASYGNAEQVVVYAGGYLKPGVQQFSQTKC